jgi:hypothetical protein
VLFILRWLLTDNEDPHATAVITDARTNPVAHTLPRTEIPLPNRAKWRHDRLEPRVKKSQTLSADPNLPLERTESEDPHDTVSTMDIFRKDPKRMLPTTESALPLRTAERIESEDPRTRASQRDALPRIWKDARTESDEPICTCFRTDAMTPLCERYRLPNTETLLPHRAKPRIDKLVPMWKKSNVLALPLNLPKLLVENEEPQPIQPRQENTSPVLASALLYAPTDMELPQRAKPRRLWELPKDRKFNTLKGWP